MLRALASPPRALQEAVSLAGSHAVVTGCRHTVGYALTLRLLRCGARVLGTSRFPGAALLNYSREPDFEVWRGRLELMACDFLQPAQVGCAPMHLPEAAAVDCTSLHGFAGGLSGLVWPLQRFGGVGGCVCNGQPDTCAPVLGCCRLTHWSAALQPTRPTSTSQTPF